MCTHVLCVLWVCGCASDEARPFRQVTRKHTFPPPHTLCLKRSQQRQQAPGHTLTPPPSPNNPTASHTNTNNSGSKRKAYIALDLGGEPQYLELQTVHEEFKPVERTVKSMRWREREWVCVLRESL